jgi:cell division protein ZapA (FtsZ GTPase activity inhibitor)
MNLDLEISNALVSLGGAEKTLRAVAHRMNEDVGKLGKYSREHDLAKEKLGRLESAIEKLVRLSADIETLDESREERMERMAKERVTRTEAHS